MRAAPTDRRLPQQEHSDVARRVYETGREFADQVRWLAIPVSEQAKPRRIEVASGNGGRSAIDATASEDE